MKTIERPLKPKSKEPLVPVAAVRCPDCVGTGRCHICKGAGAEGGKQCHLCWGSGKCPRCGGTGSV